MWMPIAIFAREISMLCGHSLLVSTAPNIP
jgi:hypothetical protein